MVAAIENLRTGGLSDNLYWNVHDLLIDVVFDKLLGSLEDEVDNAFLIQCEVLDDDAGIVGRNKGQERYRFDYRHGKLAYSANGSAVLEQRNVLAGLQEVYVEVQGGLILDSAFQVL